MSNNNDKDILVYSIIGIVSVLVLTFLAWLIYFNTGVSTKANWVSFLPEVNASLNFITTCLLIAGFVFIKKQKREAHIKTMLLATATSGLFLISYIVYHHFQGDTKFLAQGLIRPVYFLILISHIVLSIGLVPLVFSTLYHAFSKNYLKHKKFAKVTFPIWVYVSITGVLIYLFLNLFNN